MEGFLVFLSQELSVSALLLVESLSGAHRSALTAFYAHFLRTRDEEDGDSWDLKDREGEQRAAAALRTAYAEWLREPSAGAGASSEDEGALAGRGPLVVTGRAAEWCDPTGPHLLEGKVRLDGAPEEVLRGSSAQAAVGNVRCSFRPGGSSVMEHWELVLTFPRFS